MRICSGSNGDDHWVSLQSRDSGLFARQYHLDGAFSLQSQQREVNLDSDLVFASECSPDDRRYYAYLLAWNSERSGDLKLVPVWSLAAHIEDNVPVLVEESYTSLSFQEHVHLAAGPIRVLDHDCTLLECGLHVTVSDVSVAIDVAGFVDSWRSRLHRLNGVRNHRERFIIDFDEVERAVSCLRILCRNKCNGVAFVADLVLTQNRLIRSHDPVSVCSLNVFVRENSNDARQGLCPRDVDTFDQRVGAVSSEYPAV